MLSMNTNLLLFTEIDLVDRIYLAISVERVSRITVTRI